MKAVREFIESGILELYVMGDTSPEETLLVEQMASTYPEIRKEISEVSEALENYALAQAIEPEPVMKPFVMATIDYMERIEKGEQPVFPPPLNQESVAEDYADLLSREDMVVPEDFTGIHAKIIGYTPSLTTAVIWIKDVEINEVHHDEIEKFMILEGSCTITVGNNTYDLFPGDFMTIPLHENHIVKITSDIPCKAILQRVAA